MIDIDGNNGFGSSFQEEMSDAKLAERIFEERMSAEMRREETVDREKGAGALGKQSAGVTLSKVQELYV